MGKGFDANAFVFGLYLLFLDERTERAEDLLRVKEKAEERACAPFWFRWCCWEMFGAREGVGVRKRGKRERPPLLPLLGRDLFYRKKRIRDVIFLYPLIFLGWWSDRRLTAVFTKNRLATISFSCRGW